jgi:hypothetical protein
MYEPLYITPDVWHWGLNRIVIFDPVLEMIAVHEESLDVIFVIRRYLIYESRFDFTKPVV